VCIHCWINTTWQRSSCALMPLNPCTMQLVLLFQIRQAAQIGCSHCSNTRCQDPALFASLGQADKYFIVDRWVPRHRQVQCEEEQTGADIVITCIKTKEWHDTLMQCYNKNCAWLQAITEAVKEVCPFLTHTLTHSLTHSLVNACI